ncbi:MAG: radical SAM protein [Methanothrix sp.]|nr:radical SAM protein [Methanothrix sp.]
MSSDIMAGRQIAYGPVPSRRLGRSLGVNNITPKVCTYSCIYCQLGRTSHMEVKRRAFFSADEIIRSVEERVKDVMAAGQRIDYVTFVPDGEPTLDIDLGDEIGRLKALGHRVAVISNSSLIWDEGVREELMIADYVSLKVDTVQERTWRRINRPHRSLRLQPILDGILEFSQGYEGTLATETMLVRGLNDDDRSLRQTAEFLSLADPERAYISAPIRPPAEAWVDMPAEARLRSAHKIYSELMVEAELLVGEEGDRFTFTGDPREEILAITAVHPMREEALRRLLDRAGAGWDVVQSMLERGELQKAEYRGRRFYRGRL